MTTIIYGVNWTNRSGTITAANTAQEVAAANPNRKGFWFQNVSDTAMWISEQGAAVATQPAIFVPAGAIYEFPVATGTAISVICSASAKAFSAREW